MNEQLRFPIGEYSAPDVITFDQINAWIDEIEALPHELEKAVDRLTEAQWNTTYRPDGWTLLQVVHHIADSHMNSYIRFKLALTEENPTIRPYFEDRWAELKDGKQTPAEFSLNLIENLHKRWVIFLRSLTEDNFERGFIHPEHGRKLLLKEVVGLYAWHGKHHLNHILQTKKLNNW